MDDIDYTKLIKLVKNSTKKNYNTYVSNGKVIPNLGNLGGKIGDIAKLERKGEYYGISVELLENLKPILTRNFVIRILERLKKEDYMTILSLLNLDTIDQIYYILHTWFEVATTGYDGSLKIFKKKYTNFDSWIRSVTHDPLLGKIRIVDIGYNAKTDSSVVPEDWIGREFDDAYSLHSKMNKLESRLNKPPVTFAVIYSMIVQKKDDMIEDISNIDYDHIFYLDWNHDRFITKQTNEPRKKYCYVSYGRILVGFKLNDIFEPKKSDSGNNTVGVLVSRLQKSIRRGRYGSKALVETIDSINSSANYNLPEHGFLRVSSCRQLVWRLFITILEDCRPYQEIDEPSLLDLLLLTLITQKVTEYSFKKKVLDSIKTLALLAQYNDTLSDSHDWRNLKLAKKTPLIDSNFHNAISLALDHVTMMSGDRKMLSKYYSEKNIFEPFVVPKKFLHNDEIYEDIMLSSYDMHCKPLIILYYQACIPISLTTKEISSYIWNASSKYNVRYSADFESDPILKSIQNYFYSENVDSIDEPYDQSIEKIKILKPSPQASRVSFLILFGQKHRFNGKEIILAGTPEEPIRIKSKKEWTFSNDKKYLAAFTPKTINVSDIDPPFGFRWTKKKFSVKILKGKPILDNEEIPFFDGSIALKSITPKITSFVKKPLYKTIIKMFSGMEIKFDLIQNFRSRRMKVLKNWLPKKSDINRLNMDLIIGVYTKIFNQFNNLISIGPVNRSGNKMQNSINYLLEGKIWAIFCLLSYLYPSTIKIQGALNFAIKKNTPGYIHLIETLRKILFSEKKMTGKAPVIETSLWDHQKNSVSRIISAFLNEKHGFGDAGDVGSGKTLTALKISAELIEKTDSIYFGILVLLPCNQLIDTWKDELAKHTKGFKVIFQKNSSDVGPITRNTIVISTVARIRDHPINHTWLLVIIDECLTVQNKNSLQSESAWKQSLMSKFLIMMSATFFRARFDKLYYMLKMLQTGLPERKEYLETILLESIVSQIPNIKRKWTSNYHYFELDKKTRIKYNKIDSSDLSTEIKFAKLASLLVSSSKTNQFLVKQLRKLIDEKEGEGHRCLLYARANEEAEIWSKELDIPVYPKKGTHCIITYHDGTYGLNDLIIYDTIVMRPPTPDSLPQIKGRLDRPGNESDNLYIEYFVLKDTIEIGLILRLEIASQFVSKYIMPLAKFYDVSVNYSKYLN